MSYIPKYFNLIILILIFDFTFSGTTGKITGLVKDKKSNEPIIGASIFVIGTNLGAASDVDGYYFINNLPPGNYNLKITSVGYGSVIIEKINVKSDLTTKIDIVLTEEILDIGEEVVVVAQRPLVQKDLTSTTATVGGDEIKQLPVTEVSQVVGLQAGNVAGHMRGGRGGEVAYWIDGVPITDVFDGGTVVDVNTSMVQELQVLSGAFNAEYGQAMSGIVNITTRESAEKFSGSFSTYFGDYFSSHNQIFKNINDFSPVNIRNFELNLNGPIIKDKLSFFLNARNIYFGGHLNGVRKYNPNTVATIRNNSLYIFGTDYTTDSTLIYPNLSSYHKSNSDLTKNAIDSIRSLYGNILGNNKTVPMNWNEKIYLQGKISYKFSPFLKFGLNFILDNVESNSYDRYFQFNPDGKGKDFRNSYTAISTINHTLSNSTFYSLGLSVYQKAFKHYLYENLFDSKYVHPDLFITPNTISFLTGGTDLSNFYRSTNSAVLKFDLSSQIDNNHFVKVGFETRKHRIFLEDIRLRPIDLQTAFTPGYSTPFISTRVLPDSSTQHDRYIHNPLEISGYIQDKMEFEDIILNVGIRFDYFNPDGKILTDDEDPNIYSPYKFQNQFFDYNQNGIRESNEPLKSVSDRESYWYKKASSKFKISPRFGASFPITDRGIFHFSYGHFFQIPNFYQLYQNPKFKTGSGTGNVDFGGSPTGNADLNPEQTINGEIGLQQQISDDMSIDVTAYLRDIRNLTGTRADEITIGGPLGASRYTKYINSDFGFVRGFIFSLDKRISDGVSVTLDYTYQIAKGSASSSSEARNQLAAGLLPEVQLTPLGWDQKHTINSTITYNRENFGGSLIAQFGSGTPYTPDVTRDVTTFLTNSQTKPTYLNVDLRMQYNLNVLNFNSVIFVRVNNLFDRLNEVGVWGDTGRAGKTYYEDLARQSGALELVNSISDYYLIPTNYSEPRRIEIGTTIDF